MPSHPRRKSIRLRGYDYSQDGAYFVTLVARDRRCLFGEVVDGVMRLNRCGEAVAAAWEWLAERHPYVHLDTWIVMPNHLHGVIVLGDDGDWVVGPRNLPGYRMILPDLPAPDESGTTDPTGTTDRRGRSRTAPNPATAQRAVMIRHDRDGSDPATAPDGPTSDRGPHPDRGGRSRTAPTTASTDSAPPRKSLGRLLAAFKTVSTRHIHQILGPQARPIWQRNYYEHVVRDSTSLHRIRQYILENPARWDEDEENPVHLGRLA